MIRRIWNWLTRRKRSAKVELSEEYLAKVTARNPFLFKPRRIAVLHMVAKHCKGGFGHIGGMMGGGGA